MMVINRSEEEEGSEGFLGLDYALIGKRDEAEALRKSAKFRNHLALICAGLGDKDCVFEALNPMARHQGSSRPLLYRLS